MSDPLPVVARLRALAVDEARRALAENVTAEANAAEALRLVDTVIAAETEAAGDLSGDDQSVEDFAGWLRRIRVERRAAAAALESAELRSTEARAALAASRSAARAMEELLLRRDADWRSAAERREQAVLDEVGQRALE
jgi:flagellar export protein FliJ